MWCCNSKSARNRTPRSTRPQGDIPLNGLMQHHRRWIMLSLKIHPSLVSGQNVHVRWSDPGCSAEASSHIEQKAGSPTHYWKKWRKKIKVSPRICVVTLWNLWWIMKNGKRACSDGYSWTHLVSARLHKPGKSPLCFSLQLVRQGVSFRLQSDEKKSWWIDRKSKGVASTWTQLHCVIPCLLKSLRM